MATMVTMDPYASLTGLTDDCLPLMPALLGEGASDMIAAATGLDVQRVTPRQVHWRPGHSLLVVADVAAADAPSQVYVMATGGELLPGAAILEHDRHRAATWPLAADPALPGLAVALDPVRTAALLAQVGVTATEVRCTLRSYRAGRRAVVEVTGPDLRLFIKVVRPSRVAALQRRHRLASEVLPVPRSHGWADEHGLVVLESIPGRTLRDALATSGEPLIAPTAIFGLLAALPDPGEAGAPSSVRTTAGGHLPLLKRLLPHLAGRLDALASTIEEVPDEAAPTVLHGDLHDRQLLVADGGITGIVDIDTMGPAPPATTTRRSSATSPHGKRGRLTMAASAITRGPYSRWATRQCIPGTCAALSRLPSSASRRDPSGCSRLAGNPRPNGASPSPKRGLPVPGVSMKKLSCPSKGALRRGCQSESQPPQEEQECKRTNRQRRARIGRWWALASLALRSSRLSDSPSRPRAAARVRLLRRSNSATACQ
jgi:hypothetical protein